MWLCVLQSKVRGRFRKSLWPSQNIWTLTSKLREISSNFVAFSKYMNFTRTGNIHQIMWYVRYGFKQALVPMWIPVLHRMRSVSGIISFFPLHFWCTLSSGNWAKWFFDIEPHCCCVQLKHCEKSTNLEINLPLVLTKQLFLLCSVKTSGRLFQIFVAFSEKLNFSSSSAAKGQIISEYLFDVFNFPKNQWKVDKFLP